MNNKRLKKIGAITLAALMTVSALAGCASSATVESTTDAAETTASTESETKATEMAKAEGGTIIWLSNLSSGAQYDAAVAYGTEIASSFGYDLKIVYGDPYNDPDGNLSAVKNAMTKDVVGIISSQDGGILNIVEEYPDLYVAGYNTSMEAVYGEGGAAAALQENDHFLGSITDGYYDGVNTGKQMAMAVIEQGYTSVATMNFPGYAYPDSPVADAAFRAEIKKHNETSSTPIEIVGEVKTLEFAPLEESWFLEENNADIGAIVAFCAGTTFIYPTMKSAIASGACSADTKLLTAGFDTDESILADIGGEGVIQYIKISPTENIAYSIALVAKAVSNTMYEDYTKNERIDSIEYIIDSTEDVNNVMTKSLIGTIDPLDAQLSPEEVQACTTYAQLKEILMSQQLTVDALANR